MRGRELLVPRGTGRFIPFHLLDTAFLALLSALRWAHVHGAADGGVPPGPSSLQDAHRVL